MAIFEPNIYMREIKELYSEELALLKQIRSYGREHSQGKMERVEKVKLLLLFRIYSNLYSSLLYALQLDDDILLLAQKDEMGRALQDLALKHRERASKKQ